MHCTTLVNLEVVAEMPVRTRLKYSGAMPGISVLVVHPQDGFSHSLWRSAEEQHPGRDSEWSDVFDHWLW